MLSPALGTVSLHLLQPASCANHSCHHELVDCATCPPAFCAMRLLKSVPQVQSAQE
ncbi:hypothetical protein I79_004697 [Cricetulus griseus]|uniref:Uncharacterized protein n=1 Tax=Cricetulus griseus TaxID=10029 RepID=G3H382_CRIGR|nr:hypothetical protein I79_004697 [Cricetulus griseus]